MRRPAVCRSNRRPRNGYEKAPLHDTRTQQRVVPPCLGLFCAITGAPASILRRSSRCTRRDPLHQIDRSLCRADKRYCFRILLKVIAIIPRFAALSTVRSGFSFVFSCILHGNGAMSDGGNAKYRCNEGERSGKERKKGRWGQTEEGSMLPCCTDVFVSFVSSRRNEGTRNRKSVPKNRDTDFSRCVCFSDFPFSRGYAILKCEIK